MGGSSWPAHCTPYLLPHSVPTSSKSMALRIPIGVPRTASSRCTLTEYRINSVESLMQERALGHLTRMSNCDSTITLLTRIAERAESRLGAHICTLGDIAGTPGPLVPLPELHKEPHPLLISLHIPGLRTKKNVAVVVARQLTEDHLVTQYDGWARVYIDGSVDPSGATATAAAFFQAAAVGTSERLAHQASSTTAELAAIRLALWGIRTGCTQALRWVILSDSRSALELLSRLERATPLARSIVQDVVELQQEGKDISFQGNEVVDFLAARDHKDPECPLSTVPRFSDAKLLVRKAIVLQHPDLVVVAGAFPALIPRGFDRQTAAVLHRLRTGSAFTPAWISRFRLNVDPICQACKEAADAEHLLQCTDHEEERTNLRDAFSRLGLLSTNLEELLRPRAPRATTDKALKSVVSFLRSSELLEIL
ncbi:hypothetical protein HPB47_017125 [Ixodes persulcatus]|uniref:Uncharacterized protein n=1 Tax=Ixodes persulcatus TaxID=34615 RepID=A0AC60QQ54_IXOPE|nr:hypothetical protein HPB47_017125 [Ixodes persulcatus]